MRFIFLIAAWLISLSPVTGKTITVNKTGPHKTIAKALQLAESGDRIVVKKGTYYENTLMINSPVTILTTEGAIIDGGGEAKDILIVRADDVHISGFSLINVGVSFLEEAAAIRLVHCKNAVIEDNRIDSCFFGIYVEYGKYAKIRNNTIRGSFTDEASAGNAIHAWKGEKLTITDNLTTGHRDGIYFEFVNNSRISNNISQFNLRYGLHFMFSNDDVYEHNLFKDNGAGVAVMFSRNITMKSNRFIHNWGGAAYGLLLKEISDGSIEGNKFIQNTIAILAEGANRLKMSENVFKLNGTAMDIKGNCMDNVIKRNNFIANTFEVVTNTKSNLNHYSENYWSNYSGYDRNRDGFGDMPYRPVNLFAKVTNEVPSATFLLHSPFVRLMEIAEKIFPQFIPESLIDDLPKMAAYEFN
ncbi:MAG: nitrous oxide reductase family maturation protein NosD [Flavobacteriales bacterium]|nr:nitrous oxide reductase family maturation protein NosD [Flavobacteriales bacterium]